MTEVAFHFGAPDKDAYTCRLLRKAAGSGAQVVVVGDAASLERLDSGLWALGPVDFVPHCTDSASESVLRHSPIVFTERAENPAEFIAPVLVQLGQAVPIGAREFSRVVEVVGLDEGDRMLARQRWRTYASWGVSIQKHDLALKEQS